MEAIIITTEMSEARNLPLAHQPQWRISTSPEFSDATSTQLQSHNSENVSPPTTLRHLPRRRSMGGRTRLALLCLVSTLPIATAQTSNCISLTGSSQCSAFNASSISTDSFMTATLYGYARLDTFLGKADSC